MNLKSVSLLVAAGLSVAACGGSGKASPDEFQVVDRAPLVVPPEADLTPPAPGKARAQEIDPGRQAFEALFPGKKYTPKPKSKGEVALLSRIGRADADVRSNTSGKKDVQVVKKTLLLADLLKATDRQFEPDNIAIRRVAEGSKAEGDN
ncbi:DUF3035 domain-containing protein [Kordiimonas marina]|uniref:DUF3035 domain-containing protein n=1 Tax=Kordiimonas marina TaxID=2872312 RepID=UPI001FF2F964|nr:DUF3035 domain-containing protein [Kordiimonas marina]MCJ9428466.1 DUF3035 domain-containing protein [Kordiimonas marina]